MSHNTEKYFLQFRSAMAMSERSIYTGRQNLPGAHSVPGFLIKKELTFLFGKTMVTHSGDDVIMISISTQSGLIIHFYETGACVFEG